MNGIKYIFFVLVASLLISLNLFAQIDEEFDMQNEEELEEETPEKKIDPRIKMWYLMGNGAFKDSTKLDTLQDYFHLYHPLYKENVSISELGNYGSPYINNDFFNRNAEMDFLFLRTRDAYLLTPEKIKYFNTATPYTQMDYSQSENKNRKNETRFNVLHTQNINPYWNFTFRFDQARSEGQYKRQASKNNFLTLYSSYNKNQINVHSGFITNAIQNNENGGIRKDAFDEKRILDNIVTEDIDVNLPNDTKSEFKNIYVFSNGEYRFGKFNVIQTETDTFKQFRPIVGILYSFGYQRHVKQFKDNESEDNTFFPTSYYGEDFINDSIIFRKVSNIIQLKQYENSNRKTSFGKRAFIGQEFVKAESPGPIADVVNRQTKRFSNVYAGGGIFRETGNFWKWNFDGRLFLLGRNAGQTELNGQISKPFSILGDSLALLFIKGKIENRVSDYFEEEFYSNHIRWKNDFKMEQNMTVNGTISFPKYKFKAGANYAIINNYIYIDTAGIPAQTEKELLVLSAFIDKDFNYRNLHFRTRALWQKASNNEFIHIPEFSTFVSAYYKFVVSKVLYTQLGVDARYNTSYFADAYDPSTGLFFLQNEIKVGDFPYIDVYASLRLKRTRVFFKMKNIGTSFINREYYTVPYYPMNRMTFRLGVQWVFYD